MIARRVDVGRERSDMRLKLTARVLDKSGGNAAKRQPFPQPAPTRM